MISNLFNDSDHRNITREEHAAMKQILKSDRGALLAKELLYQMSQMDDKAPTYFLGIIPAISQIQATNYNTRLRNLRGNVSLLGRMLSADVVTSGTRKGSPRFMSKKFTEWTQMNIVSVLEYVQELTNFQNFAREVQSGSRSELPKASWVCQCDELMRMNLLRFCKFLDELETKDIKDLVCRSMLEDNPSLLDMIEWHREHRSEWDDISPKKKSRGKKNG
ncbi:MAG: hypothetical protein IK038_03070 [Bacteroidaceae bacterium]|nr:hypothetical protein [Bacteroidaceae bacterium]